MTSSELNRELGNMDIHLLDQVLKGRFTPGMRILDAGCGEGRNLIYFLKNGYDVYALDQDTTAVKMARMQAATLGANVESCRFVTGNLTGLPFKDNFFDATISINVLHLAGDEDAFYTCFRELIRVTVPKGHLFIKMMALKGVEHPEKTENGLYKLPDDSVRFLFSDAILKEIENLKEVTYAESLRYEIIPGKGSWVFLVIRKKNS